MEPPDQGSNWIVDEETHSSDYSYLRDHLNKEPYKLGGVPFHQCYAGYISPDRDVLIAVGEVESSSYDSNIFILLVGSLWEIPTLELASKVPSWMLPVDGSVNKAKDTARGLRSLVERTGANLSAVSEGNEIRNHIYGTDGDSESSEDDLVESYLTDYLISVQWERKHPETAWSCNECGSTREHDVEKGVTFHILEGKDGFFYPYRMWCSEHSISKFDQLGYQIPPNSEIVSYFDNLGEEENRSSNVEKQIFYHNLMTMAPIERQYIVRCNLSVGNFNGYRHFLSITDPTVLSEVLC